MSAVLMGVRARWTAVRRRLARVIWPGVAEAARRRSDLEVLVQTGQAVAAVLDLDRLLEIALEQVAAHTRFKRACIILGPSGEGHYGIAASSGLSADHLEAYGRLLDGPAGAFSPNGWVRLAGQPVVIPDVARDFPLQSIQDVFVSAGIGSVMAVPMLANDRFRGSLSVYLDEPTVFDHNEVSLVAALASQLAMAVENAHLYSETVKQRQQLDRALAFIEHAAAGLAQTRVGIAPFLRQVAEAAAMLFSPASVQLVLPGEQQQTVSSTHGIEEPWHLDVYGEVAAAQDPGWSGLNYPAALCLPIILDDRRQGHIEVYLAGEGRTLGDEECSILQAFAHLTSSALGNARLVSELRTAVSSAETAFRGTLEALTRVLETRDHETEGHCRRVVHYTLALTHQLRLSDKDVLHIVRGALLHDIGKVAIPDGILRKPGPLGPDEWEIMRTHTIAGHQMLYPIDFLRPSAAIILHHHERYDGSGYPHGLQGTRIPVGARIFAVADAYDAITSDRPYRPGRSHQEAVAELVRCAGTHFDPEIVNAFLGVPEIDLHRIRANWRETPLPAGTVSVSPHRTYRIDLNRMNLPDPSVRG